MRLLSALFCPATAAVCLGKTFWDSKLTAWIRLRLTGRSTAPCAHETACVRARTQYVAQTWDDCPFQVSSSWRSRGWVQEEDSNPCDPQRLFKGLSGMRRVFAGFCKFQVVRDATVSPSRLVRKLTALYWLSNGVSLQKRRPKLLQTTTQALKNCSILKILFFSKVRL